MKLKFTLLVAITLFLTNNFKAQVSGTLTLTVVSITNASCPDAGQVVLGGNGVGHPSVVFKIISGPSHVGLQQSSAIFNSLSTGSYTFEANDGTQTAQVSATINNTYSPINTNFSVTVSGVCTNYTPGGTIAIGAVGGGTPPYQYSFVKNNFANYDDALSVYTNSNTFNATSWGTYQVRVKDACGVFNTKTTTVEAIYDPVKFSGANTRFEGMHCDSAKLEFWMHNDEYEGVDMTTFSSLRFRIFEKGAGCTPGALIKTFVLTSSSGMSFIAPKRDIFIETTTPCGDVRTNCFDYPDTDSVETYWEPLVKGCGTVADPYLLSIKHLYNNYCRPPFQVKLYNNTTNVLLQTNSYTDNENCAQYNGLALGQYRIEVVDFCGNGDTILVESPSGAIGIAPYNNGTVVNQECTFKDGKTSVQLKLTGFIANLDITTITITTGPDNIGKTATIDPITFRFYFTNLTPGATYGFSVSNGCSILNINFTVPVNEWRVVKYNMAPSVTQQCGGSGTISANIVYYGWGVVTTELWKSGLKVSENNSGVYTNVSPGVYTVRSIASQTWCDGPKHDTLSGTVTVYPDDTPPQLLRQFAFVCETAGVPGVTGSANIEVAGFGPYKYEIKRIFPSPQTSFTLVASNAPGNYSIPGLDAYAIYDLLITDNCGKSTVTQISVGTIGTLALENFLQPCAGNNYVLASQNIPGATYSWRKDGSPVVLSTNNILFFTNYNVSYDGKYTCTVVLSNGCLSRNVVVTLNSFICGALLPVKLTEWSVAAEGCSASIKWGAAGKLNGYYEIEHSSNGNNFTKIGQKNGAANNLEGIQEFTFLFENMNPGNNYFRLKMVEQNAKESYSTVLYLNNKCSVNKNSVRIYPNPVTGANVNLYITLSEKSLMNISVVNTVGAVVKQLQYEMVAGENRISIHTDKLPQGIYFLKTMNANGSISLTKFIKK